MTALGLLLLAFAAVNRRRAPLFVVPSTISRAAVTAAQEVDGWIRTPPAELARRAGVPIDVYTLARFLASEVSRARGADHDMERIAIAWTILNEAHRRDRERVAGVRWNLPRLATWIGRQGDSGLYGRQHQGRFASTHADPGGAEIYIARQILAGAWPDPTGGATMFFSPAAQRDLNARFPCPRESGPCWDSPEAKITQLTRGSTRREAIAVRGVDPDRQLFFRAVA